MAKLLFVVFAAALLAGSRAQDDACPEKDGFFADSTQCDRYYECKNFELTEKLCPDGMVFADLPSGIERCDFPFNVDCKDRPELQAAKKSTNCPRANGYFPHPDRKVCNQFFFCSDGQFNQITCPDGLVFSEKTGTCSWPGEAQRTGCGSADVIEFDCPKRSESDTSIVTNPLYPDPNDCQFFYVCINGQEPRRNGCTRGLVFNDANKRCDKPKNVPECKDWYKTNGEEEEESDEIDLPPPTPRPKKTRPVA